MTKSLRKRDVGIDIIKTVAVLSVISVHFFLHTGFYSFPVSGKRMFIMIFMRTAFMICVPLFIVVSGYLSGKSTFTRKYYKSISRVLILYLLASIVCCLYKGFFTEGYELTLSHVINDILSFSGADYAWYVEMYIGLFLIIPFLNTMYHSLDCKEKKLGLVITMLALTTLPTVINSFYRLVPSWWVGIYPLMYYFMGMYLKEYPVKIKPVLNIVLWIAALFVFTVFNFKYNYGGYFKWSDFVGWAGWQNVISTFLVFTFFTNLDYSRMKRPFRKMFYVIADLSFCIYLVSCIFDKIFYSALNAQVTEVLYRLPYFPVAVAFVFVCSFAVSFVINIVYKLIDYGIKSIGK